MAAAGFIPFVSTFAKFVSRAYDQVEMAQITRANIKIVGSHAGISLAADGPSQMSLHDVAFFRSASETDDGFGRPACVSFHPADAVAAYYCTWLMAQHVGMCYMRTHRPDVALLYRPDTRFEVGGSHVLAEGDALTIVSAGYMVHECKRALTELAAAGVRCTLIDAYSFPLRADPILAAGKKSGGRMLVVEDNYIGGLAGAVAEAAAAQGGIRVWSMTCRKIPKSAKSTDQIMAYAGLSAGAIAKRARELSS
jgi:transketolase